MDDNSLINFRLLPSEQNLKIKGNSFNSTSKCRNMVRHNLKIFEEFEDFQKSSPNSGETSCDTETCNTAALLKD